MKRFLRAVSLIGLLALLCMPALASDYTWSKFDMECRADQTGSTAVTVTATADLSSAMDTLTVPLGAHVSGVTATGASYRTRRHNGIIQLEFTPTSGFTGALPISWSYTVNNAVTTLEDGQQFALPLLGAQTGDLGNASYTITLPDTFEQAPVFTSGYYADGVDNYMDISVASGVIQAKLKQPLMAGDTLNVSLSLPADFFNLRHVAGQSVKADRIALLAAYLLCAVYWFFRLRSPLLRLRRQSRAPAGVSAGVIPYLLYGNPPDLALQAVFWAGRGYLTMHREATGPIVLQRRMVMGNERNADETKIFAALFSQSARVRHTDTIYRRTAAYTVQPVSKFWRRRLFSRRTGNPMLLRILALAGMFAGSLHMADLLLPNFRMRLVPMLLLAAAGTALGFVIQQTLLRMRQTPHLREALPGLGAAIVLLIAGSLSDSSAIIFLSILLQLLCCFGIWFGGIRNPGGVDLLAQLLGFRRYLRRLTPDDAARLMQQDPQYFYKTLPYAEALGVGARFTAAFKQLRLEPCNWLHSARGAIPQDAATFRRYLCTILWTMRGEPHRPQPRRRRAAARKPQPRRHLAAAVPARSRRQEPVRDHAPAYSSRGEYNHEIGRNNNPSGQRRHRSAETEEP